MTRKRKAKQARISVRAGRDTTVGGDLVGRDKIKIEKHYHGDAGGTLRAKPPRKLPPSYDILPHSFEIWLHQDIPHVQVWFYVVNYLAAELILQTFSITSFHLSGGPGIENITANGEVRIPPHQSVHVMCRKNLIDTEARAIERTPQSIQSNATLSISTRGFAGRRKFNQDLLARSMNGWIRGIPSSQ
jgi:hypothetical protein